MFFPYKDDNPRILIPYVTYIILGLNTLVFLYQFGLGISDGYAERKFIYTFGLIPAQFSILNIFTSMFVHGGLAHFAGNMWFLWIFGDNVESSLGHYRYILFYLTCGVVAALCQVSLDAQSQIPMVGASGAIRIRLLSGALGLTNSATFSILVRDCSSVQYTSPFSSVKATRPSGAFACTV